MPLSILTNPANARELRANQNGGYLSVTSTTVITFAVFNGELLEIADDNVAISSLGTLSNTANTLTGAGADAGAGPSVSTLYTIYASNNRPAFAPLQLRLGGVAGFTSTTSGQRYLGSTGDALFWRAIGQVYISAAGTFIDTPAQRYLRNWNNQQPKSLLCRPGYTDDNAQTQIVPANANFNLVNAGANDSVEWIADGFSAVWLSMGLALVTGPAGISHYGIGLDSTATATVAAIAAAAAVNVCLHVSHCYVPSAGYHKASMLAKTALGATLASDLVRGGGTLDPSATYLTGWALL